jgi:predicted TIM-barrel fold metal-dependent hydrolase
MDRIDADVHCAPSSMQALAPYLSEYWHQYLDGARVTVRGMAEAYPPGAPTSASARARSFAPPAVPDSYEALRERVLEPERPDRIVLSCLTALEAYRNPYYAAALAGAVNDWVRHELLDRDERLRALIAVSIDDPVDAVAEIERRADDCGFVGVLLPVRSDQPWGHKRNHPVFEAAAERALPVVLHAWGRPTAGPTPSGFTTTYMENYLGNQTIAQMQLVSLVCEGVFERFPELHVVLAECGFTWLAPLLWRFDKDWKGIWRETPWVRERPSTYVYRQVRATTAPAHLPAEGAALTRLRETTDLTRLLLYASDYPHDHGDGVGALLEQLDSVGRAAVLAGNATEIYRDLTVTSR